MEVKICGIRDVDAARIAVEAGATAIGLVFAESPRRVEPVAAARIAAALPPDVAAVAVFRYPSRDDVLRVLAAVPVDFIQAERGAAALAAEETGVPLLPVLHDGPGLVESLPADESGPVLLEAAGRGGRGVRPDWSRAARLAERCSLVLAGGLGPDNVADAIRRVGPAAVDVSSGVESRPGVKDAQRIRAFIREARAAGSDLSRPARFAPPVFRVVRAPR